jgi:hypothetical protein
MTLKLPFGTTAAGVAQSIVSEHRLDDRGSTPGRGKKVFLQPVSRPALMPTQPPIQWVPGSFPCGKVRPGRDADHSPSSDEVKNE